MKAIVSGVALLVSIYIIATFNLTNSLLISVLIISQLVTLFFTAYQTIISTLGMLWKRGTGYLNNTVGRRYALVVCAHNEEQVVGDIVNNLQQLDYPRELYDIYVIADNCSDNTARIVRDLGAIAMERHDKTKVGKGYGIEWFLDELWGLEDEGKHYDAVAIFDADNLVTTNFLKQVNAKMDADHEVIQVYIDSKNPNDTWITRSYAFSYWATSRIYQLARENIGLSAQLGGTGMVFSASVLKEMGWEAKSLTEDLEFTVKYHLERNKSVAWLHTAKIYDEKPLKFKQSFAQRIRWMKGHFDCAFRYFKPLVKNIVKGNGSRLASLDILIYLIQPTKIVLATSGFGFFFLSLFDPLPNYIQKYVLNVWWAILIPYYALPFIGLVLEKQGKRAWWFIQTYLFSLSWIPIVVYSFFRRNEKTWNPTQHTRSMSIEEVFKEVK